MYLYLSEYDRKVGKYKRKGRINTQDEYDTTFLDVMIATIELLLALR